MMRDWAKWMVDHNMRYLVVTLYILALPISITGYLTLAALVEVRYEAQHLARYVKRDLHLLLNAPKGVSK